jgi:hypothetical protein|eukprot:SAG25_NODE_295_length_10249_cov_5.144926_17_plen_132_part_00
MCVCATSRAGNAHKHGAQSSSLAVLYSPPPLPSPPSTRSSARGTGGSAGSRHAAYCLCAQLEDPLIVQGGHLYCMGAGPAARFSISMARVLCVVRRLRKREAREEVRRCQISSWWHGGEGGVGIRRREALP